MVIRLLPVVVLVLLTSLLTQCASTSITPQAGTPPTPAVAPATALPTEAPKGQKINDGARSIATDSVEKLNQADSYQFSISSTLQTTVEGKPREWKFSGTGAVAKPAKIQWSIEGQADVFFKVVSVGGQSYCADTRGEIKDCNLAFGGPKPGASPYTVISYLQNFDQVGNAATQTIQGKDYSYLTFSPSLQKVAALDSAHAKALANVASVNGEMWIDKSTKLPYQEKVLIRYKSQGSGEDTVETTITFQKYNEPVDIRLPR